MVSACCGMVTATFGGLTRDVVCQLPKQTQGVGRILHSEAPLYATTALAGGAAYVTPSSVMALLHCHYERNLREICSYKPIHPWSGHVFSTTNAISLNTLRADVVHTPTLYLKTLS